MSMLRLLGRKRSSEPAESGRIVLEGSRGRSGGSHGRVVMAMGVVFAIYAAIGVRLVHLGMGEEPGVNLPSNQASASRPDIVDRNGEVLATDIKTASLFAEPRRIVDVDEAIEKLLTVLPDLEYEQAYRRLDSDAGFVWLKRQLSPRQQADIMALGIPGLGFRTEKRRFYPGGPTASHILGLVNVDNKGIAGMEKWVDEQGLADLQALGLAARDTLEPVQLSIDLRVQYLLREELVSAVDRYKAVAAGGVVLNARTAKLSPWPRFPTSIPTIRTMLLRKIVSTA